jgi:type I restriction enzyme S subunit
MDFPPREFDRYRLESGDILLSEASGSPEQVGKPAIWRGEISKCCFQNTVIRLKPIVLTSEFLLILLKHLYWVRAFAAIAGGAGINHLSAKKFSRMPIPLPPLAEQRRIVAEVKRQLAVISSIETTVKKALKETAQLRMLLFRKAFAGRLVPQNLHDESVSSLLDYARNAQATHTEQFQKERRNRMKKARATQAGLSSETVLPLIKKTFGRKRFTFIQLAPITPGDYETLKIEIFRLLSEMNGSRLKQIFNHSNKHIELKLVS